MSIKDYQDRVRQCCSVDGCGRQRLASKNLVLCHKHYHRYLTHGDPTVVKTIVGDDKKRFLSHIEKQESGCLFWTARIHRHGYGVVALNGRLEQAHRAAWILFVGPIPSGMQVNHLCHNRHCVSTAHLYLGDQKQNMLDMKLAGRERKAVGERAGLAKLTEQQVKYIRTSPETNAAIARELEVSQTLISAVRLRKIWRHVE